MFSFFESEETKKIKSHLTNLAALAKVDGQMDASEIDFIVAIGTRHGMREGEVRNLLSSSKKIEPSLPTNDSERFDQIFDLVEMMLADGIVDENEMDFCIHMAARLGFKKSIVGVLVKKITVGVKDGLTREHIKHEAHAYLN